MCLPAVLTGNLFLNSEKATVQIYLKMGSPVCHLSHFGEHASHFTLPKVVDQRSQVQQEVVVGRENCCAQDSLQLCGKIKASSHVAVSVGTRNISCSVSHETEVHGQVNMLSYTQSDLTFLIH